MTVSALKTEKKQSSIRELLKLQGNHPMAYHTMQSGMEYYQHNDGFIAYKQFGDDVIVLSDPVVSIKGKFDLINSFLSAFKSVSFIQVSQQTVLILNHLGFQSSLFGFESSIPLPFTMIGKGKKDVRHLYNSARRNSLTVKEIFDRDIIMQASTGFIPGNKSKNGYTHHNEFNFLSRQLQSSKEEDVRIFGAFQNDKLVGFSLFDPVYSNQNIIGYAESIIRRSSTAPKGTRTFILIESMRAFHSEKITFVDIGILPFYRTSKKHFSPGTNLITDVIFSGLYNVSPLIQNFRGISFHKTRYRGELKPVYFASQNKIPVISLLKINKLTTGRWL